MSTSATPKSPLEPFSEPVRRWFEASFEGRHARPGGRLARDRLGREHADLRPDGLGQDAGAPSSGGSTASRASPERLGSGVRIVYVSPLKALSYDIERNLRAPLQGIGAPISVGLRTGDTPQPSARRCAASRRTS